MDDGLWFGQVSHCAALILVSNSLDASRHIAASHRSGVADVLNEVNLTETVALRLSGVSGSAGSYY